jgi:hypothetical protein
MDVDFQRELLAFEEKIMLAEVEVAKAKERVSELKYSKARFSLDYFMASVKAQQQQQPINNPQG